MENRYKQYREGWILKVKKTMNSLPFHYFVKYMNKRKEGNILFNNALDTFYSRGQ